MPSDHNGYCALLSYTHSLAFSVLGFELVGFQVRNLFSLWPDGVHGVPVAGPEFCRGICNRTPLYEALVFGMSGPLFYHALVFVVFALIFAIRVQSNPIQSIARTRFLR